MILSVPQAEHAGNIEQKCRWTHAVWSKSFRVSSISSSMFPFLHVPSYLSAFPPQVHRMKSKSSTLEEQNNPMNCNSN